jgi:excisionase family DNA binding protein
MADRKKKLTTFQIANMLGVSDQSIANWIDAGLLPAERTPGGHRRVEPDDLVGFLTDRGMRIPSELAPTSPTILIVDDETETADVLRKAIRKAFPEIRVLVASDGFDAGRVVVAERPALVILDLYMPGLDGFEVCRRIKADAGTRSTRVVAVTAHPSPEAERDILDAGAETCLAKPVGAKAIATVVREMLNMPA